MWATSTVESLINLPNCLWCQAGNPSKQHDLPVLSLKTVFQLSRTGRVAAQSIPHLRPELFSSRNQRDLLFSFPFFALSTQPCALSCISFNAPLFPPDRHGCTPKGSLDFPYATFSIVTKDPYGIGTAMSDGSSVTI